MQRKEGQPKVHLEMFGYATVILFKIAFPKFLMGEKKKKALLLRMLQSAAWEGLCVAEEPASTAAALPGSLGACWTPATGSPYYTCSFFIRSTCALLIF